MSYYRSSYLRFVRKVSYQETRASMFSWPCFMFYQQSTVSNEYWPSCLSGSECWLYLGSSLAFPFCTWTNSITPRYDHPETISYPSYVHRCISTSMPIPGMTTRSQSNRITNSRALDFYCVGSRTLGAGVFPPACRLQVWPPGDHTATIVFQQMYFHQHAASKYD